MKYLLIGDTLYNKKKLIREAFETEGDLDSTFDSFINLFNNDLEQ